MSIGELAIELMRANALRPSDLAATVAIWTTFTFEYPATGLTLVRRTFVVVAFIRIARQAPNRGSFDVPVQRRVEDH